MRVGSLEIEILAGIARLQKDMNDAQRIVGGSMANVEKSVASAKQAMQTLGVGLPLIGITDQVRRMTDQYTKLDAQLRLSTKTQAQYTQGLVDLRRISATAQSDINATSMLYTRLMQVTDGMGVSQSKIATITETVSYGLKAYGATAQEAASASLQLSQAMGANRLGGEEFRAVMEAMPNVMKVLANSMGVPLGELRALSIAGKITADEMVKAFGDPAIAAQFKAMALNTQTVTGAWVVARNELMLLVGEFGKSSGGVNIFIGVFKALGETFALMAQYMQQLVSLATVMSVLYAGKYVVAMQSAWMVTRAHTEALVMDAAGEKARAVIVEASAAQDVAAKQLRVMASREAFIASMAEMKAAVEGAVTAEARTAAELRLAAATQKVTAANVAAIAEERARTTAMVASAAAEEARVAATLSGFAKIRAFAVSNAFGLIGLALWGAYEIADHLGWIDKVFASADTRLKKLREDILSAREIPSQAGGKKTGDAGSFSVVPGLVEDAAKQYFASVGASAKDFKAYVQNDSFVFSKDFLSKEQEQAAKAAKITADYYAEMDRLQKTAGLSSKAYKDAAIQIHATYVQNLDALNKKDIAAAGNAHTSKMQQALAALEAEAAAEEGKLSRVQKVSLEWQALKKKEQTIAQYGVFILAVQKAAELDEIDRKAELNKQLATGQVAYEEYWTSVATSTEKIIEQAKQQEFENTLIGKTKDEIAALTAKRENDTIAKMEAIRVTMTDTSTAKEIADYEALIAAKKRSQAADVDKTVIEAQTAARAAQTKAEEERWKMIDGFAHNAFDNILDKGKNVFSEIGNAIKKYVLDMLYKMTVQKWLINVGVAGGGTGAAGSAMAGGMSGTGGGGSTGSMLSMGQTLWSGFSGGMASGMGSMISSAGSALGSTALSSFGAGMQGATLGAGMAGPTTAGAAGATGMGASFAVAMPYIAAALALYAVYKGLNGGETRSGGTYGAQGQLIHGPSGGQIAGDTITKSIIDTNTNINMLLGKFGSTATLTGFAGYLESSNGGRGGAYAAGTVGGQRLVANTLGTGEKAWGQSLTDQQAATQFADDMARLTLMALQSAKDIPPYLQTVFNSIDPMKATPQLINDTIAFADTLKTVRGALTETRTPLEIASAQMATLAGDLHTSASGFRTDFVAAIDAGITPETLAKWQTLGVLIDQTTAAQTAAAEEQAQTAQTRMSWQNQYDLVTGKTTQTQLDRQAQLASTTDATTLSLMRHTFAAQDLKIASDAAAEAAKKEADLKLTWQQKLDILIGKTTQQEIDRAALLDSTTDEGTKTIMKRVFALEDEKKASDASTAAIQTMIDTLSVGWGEISNAAQSAVDTVMNLTGGVGGSFTARGSSQMTGLQELITNTQAQLGATPGDPGHGAERLRLEEIIREARVRLGGLTEDMARYVTLEAQYAGHGEQLLNLEKWYNQQKTLFEQNHLSTNALQAEYERQRLEIIKSGNAGALDSMKQLSDWLKGLGGNSQLSPLTPAQQQADAMAQYEKDLKLAQGGDAAAIGRLSREAEAVLAAQKAMTGFGGDYSAIYNRIRAEIEALVNPVTPPSDYYDIIPPMMQTANNTAAESLAEQRAIRAELADTRATLARLLERGNTAVAAQTDRLGNAITGSGNKQAAATTNAAALAKVN